ncbi:MAG: nucleotidyl transferase AbiEii/AbiGii toxin family protein [Acidimicrobiales bacterium]|nr:MAG: nucleotidyl transferase AbiEii/AbiGii toxin family protein [Acidimicrobiales bacterium]
MFIHERSDFGDLIAAVATEKSILPQLVEKDYWIMHCLFGLTDAGFKFELKGGTSLSKGFGLIHRFSEDIDIHIQPPDDLRVGKNHNKAKDVDARGTFYDDLAAHISIPGIITVERDHAFDDSKFRSGGIRLKYPSSLGALGGMKDGILLEAGFDQVTPNRPCDISSWAFDKAVSTGIDDMTDNRAMGVVCYEPGYTLIEKLQTISTKYRRQQESGQMPTNFLRHYYDVYCLLGDQTVLDFLGSDAYKKHKNKRFRRHDDPNIAENEAFILNNDETRNQYERAYELIKSLFYEEPPSYSAILDRISDYAPQL